jgi:hypothetical protein
MQRRRLLQLGLAAGAALAVAGGAIALVQPGLRSGHLTPRSREIFRALALALLHGSLPAPGAARDAVLDAHLSRVDGTVAGLPLHVQSELSTLLSVLGTAAGRLGLAGLSTDWREASVPELQAALQAMRFSSLAARQQVYLALRELTVGAFFADAGTWQLMGYPGPTDV